MLKVGIKQMDYTAHSSSPENDQTAVVSKLFFFSPDYPFPK